MRSLKQFPINELVPSGFLGACWRILLEWKDWLAFQAPVGTTDGGSAFGWLSLFLVVPAQPYSLLQRGNILYQGPDEGGAASSILVMLHSTWPGHAS